LKATEIADKIEQFVKDIYLSGDHDMMLRSILSDGADSSGGAEAFMKFLKTEYAQENLEFFNVWQ
jgi:hypothetical protein